MSEKDLSVVNVNGTARVVLSQCFECIHRLRFQKVPIISFPRLTTRFAYLADKRITTAGMDLIRIHDRILNTDLFTAHGLPQAIWIREVRRKENAQLADYARPTAPSHSWAALARKVAGIGEELLSPDGIEKS